MSTLNRLDLPPQGKSALVAFTFSIKWDSKLLRLLLVRWKSSLLQGAISTFPSITLARWSIFSLHLHRKYSLLARLLSLPYFRAERECKTWNTIANGWRFLHAFTGARAIIDTWWGVRKVKSVRRRHASERAASKLLLCIRYLALNLKVSTPKETVRQQEKKAAAPLAKPLNAKITRQLFSPNLLKRLLTHEDLFKSFCWAPLSFGNL